MAKRQSDLMKRIAKKSETHAKARAHLAMTLAVDAAVLAANKCFNAGPERAPDFVGEMISTYNNLAYLIYEDAKDDKSLEYSKAKIDESIKRIMGVQFQPWDERHSLN